MKFIKHLIPVVIYCFFCSAGLGQNDTCLQKKLPEVHFPKNSATITKKNKILLDSIIVTYCKCLDYSLVICTPAVGENVKYAELIWDRVNSVVDYLLIKGIDTNKLIFSYDCDIGYNKYGSVFFRIDTIEYYKEPPPPHPNLLRQKKEN